VFGGLAVRCSSFSFVLWTSPGESSEWMHGAEEGT
jgi:hypothetical protein